MHQNVSRFGLLGTLIALALGPTHHAASAAAPAALVGKGELRSLSVLPDPVVLRGAEQIQQLVITGHYANGGVRDLTSQATFRAADPKVVRIQAGGMLVAVGNGRTEVTAERGGKSVTVVVTVEGADREQPTNFTNEIVPIFSKLGCNAGACHGKASGQNGFKLSLLGFEPRVDYEALTREARGRRVFPAAAETSLLLRKPTGVMPHGGGKRLDPTSRDYQLLLRWIRAGTPFGEDTDPRVVGLAIAPAHRLVPRKARQQITVTALFNDGSRHDVTASAEYLSNTPEIVAVNNLGLVETQDIPGEGTIMVRYLGHVGAFRATIPQEAPMERYPLPPPANFIDEHVFSKLQQLGVPPSELCSDGEFLRRAALDITGTLPTLDEAQKFLASPDPKKRARLVEELLDRPAYASYFALKWGDILRNRQKGLVGVGGGATRTAALHGWIRDSLAKNKPYDQFVRAILTATGNFAGDQGQPPVGWYNVLRTPQALVDDTAQVFLGTRIQCAQCHHHPYEKWSQDDYWGLAAFFARVQLGNTQKGKAPAGGRNGLPVVLAPTGQVTSPQGKVYTKPRPLDGDELIVPEEQDPRQLLVDWMVQSDNPYFSRALVNRYWAHFFGRGIVEMPDDLRVTNPPSNTALLDALAKDFLKHRYDLKYLIRTICASKTYQLSSSPNEYNAKDRQNFARFYPRRLPAEVLLDAIDQMAGVPARFVTDPAGRGGAARTTATRAIELPDEAVKTPLLAAFGKPDRASACECERSSTATLTQSLYLIGSLEVHNKLKDKNSRASRLAADSRPTADKIKEVYLLAYSRLPQADELQIAEAFLAKVITVAPEVARQQAAAANQWPYEDLLWALINTKEFLFNH